MLRGHSVKGICHFRVIVIDCRIDGEHTDSVTDTENFLTGELPVHVAGQRRQENDVSDMIFSIQNRLVEVRDRPPQGDVLVE
ncbi:hypothetical protein COFR110785_00660 [Corynebacterium frankenforstense]